MKVIKHTNKWKCSRRPKSESVECKPPLEEGWTGFHPEWCGEQPLKINLIKGHLSNVPRLIFGKVSNGFDP